LILRMYVQRGLRLGLLQAEHWADTLDAPVPQPRRRLHQMEWGAAGVALGGAAVVLGLTLTLNVEEKGEGTAHRGNSVAAPESTLAAVQKAIEVGADWAEIDVQRTLDGRVVLMHDDALRRLTGDRRSIRQIPFDQLGKIRFRPKYAREFADERIPTLDEVLAL